MIVSPAFAGKRYAVLGLARSGMTAVRTLLESGASVMAWDSRDEPRQAVLDANPEACAQGRCELADPVGADLAGFDGVVVSPGVPLNSHPIAAAAARAGVPVIGDIELFALARQDLPEHRVVGITGTNGKSTTTSLVRHLLEEAGVPARMGGNIGLPVLGTDPLEPTASASGVYVLELSSYQIDLTHNLDCDVAALLNVTPDHLDRYEGFAGYAASKARLFAMQADTRAAVFGRGDETTLGIAAREERRRTPGCVQRVDGADLAELQPGWPSLQGPHNLQNAAVAVAVVEALGLTRAQWEPALRTFCGLPHRMERVAEANGVLYINDSKATNPASAAPAIAAFRPDPAPRIHWILGGLPKGDNLDECKPWFGNIKAAYTIGDAGHLFAEILEPYTHVVRSEMMAEAIRQAMEAAVPGDVVMLSPACASFDQFRDYEARGMAFRQIVEALLEPAGEGAGATASATGGAKAR
ncbi:UDP-N-acetylmuramoyl-L-alanine--D-glutamate ligase [Novosphingobium sp. 1949]|uniref:UDP-N-acetylmuramoylalanine--D-glutamate ligase n=1 Tax=Novosphingobium organovorum TaxID=2930092 RepID=A0ABT0BJ16_9SPHN|nr:UDP-N-acetylmuramoyl-L-alanine--D-glutamate ligase [Novosphingobium organovorum]MCJ2185051.1 UDP-N-acetylmuramoyl-L-alanine--D-glutamate ligase [Novosphingobium organovorum]